MKKMIKKISLALIILALLLVANSQIANSETDNELPPPGLLPTNPFYFFKTWFEEVRTFFILDPVKKVERYKELAEKRLAEAKALIEKGKDELAQKILTKYQKHLDKALVQAKKAEEKGRDVQEVLERVSEATLKHQQVLLRIYEKVPEEARAGIERAIEASKKGYQNALQAVSGQKKKDLEAKGQQIKFQVEEKIRELKEKAKP